MVPVENPRKFRFDRCSGKFERSVVHTVVAGSLSCVAVVDSPDPGTTIHNL